MRSVSKEEIENARKVGVLDYFRACMPQELVRRGNRDYCTRTHNSLIISENGLFHWHSAGVGGNNAIDYLLKVEKMDFISAVRRLNELSITPSLQPVEKTVEKALPRPFLRPAPDKDFETARAYLMHRGISNKVIRYCQNAGIIYQTTRGGYKNCIFVGLDADGTPRGAFARSCQSAWRGDVAGSQKKYAFVIPAETPEADTLEIYEAAIDAMSGATLHQRSRGTAWHSRYYLSMGGLSYAPVDYFLSTHPQIKMIRLCLDRDEPGRAYTKRLQEHLSGRSYTVADVPPRFGKDYNDELLYEKQKCMEARE